MKITFLIMTGDDMGGTENAVVTQAAHMSSRHEVSVISLYRSRAKAFFADPAVPVTYLVDVSTGSPRPIRDAEISDSECVRLSELSSVHVDPSWDPAFNRLADIELELVLPALDTDVLIVTTPPLAAVGAQLAPPGVVLVQQEHHPSPFRHASGEPLMPFAPHMDAVVGLTESTTEWLRESLGADAPRLATIPNAVADGYRPRSSGAEPVIVMAGRIIPEKGFGHAIEAFHAVADKHPEWTLKIFGDGSERVRLKRLVDSLGRGERIFLPGSATNMAEEWAQGSIAVLSSLGSEAFGLVVVEALAAGVPVIAYDTPPGPVEIIRHEVDGLLVPTGDIERLGDAFDRLMGDEALRTRLRHAALERAEDFSASRMVPMWEELLTELIAESKTPQRATRRADRIARRAARGGSRFHPTAPADESDGWRTDHSSEEDALMASHPGLVRSGGRLAEVNDRMLPEELRHANLAHVTRALDAASVPYVVIPTTGGKSRVAVESERRSAAVRALATASGDRPVYAELLSPRSRRPGTVLASTLPHDVEVKGLRVFTPMVTTSRTLRQGPAVGCDLEFWTLDADGQTRMAPLGGTIRGKTLASLDATATTSIDGTEHPTRAELIVRDTSVVDEDVDAVWIYSGQDELRFALRSAAMFAPWIRHVHIVTADRAPDWLDANHPGVTVVPFAEIFDGPFSVQAVESRLHHIDGLSERFIYFNDDVFLGRSLARTRFFRSNGTALSFPSESQVALGPVTAEDDDYVAGYKHARALIEQEFDRTPTYSYLHAPHPALRSVLTELEERFSAQWKDLAEGADNRVSVFGALLPEYGFLTQRHARGSLSASYFETARRENHASMTRLLTMRNLDAFCLNTRSVGNVPAGERALVVTALLTAYFPVPSPFEKA